MAVKTERERERERERKRETDRQTAKKLKEYVIFSKRYKATVTITVNKQTRGFRNQTMQSCMLPFFWWFQ